MARLFYNHRSARDRRRVRSFQSVPSTAGGRGRRHWVGEALVERIAGCQNQRAFVAHEISLEMLNGRNRKIIQRASRGPRFRSPLYLRFIPLLASPPCKYRRGGRWNSGVFARIRISSQLRSLEKFDRIKKSRSLSTCDLGIARLDLSPCGYSPRIQIRRSSAVRFYTAVAKNTGRIAPLYIRTHESVYSNIARYPKRRP